MGIARAMPYIDVIASILARTRTMLGTHLRPLCIAGLLSAAFGARAAPPATAEAYDPWPGLVQDIFNNRPMNDGADVIAIEMPYRAEDAAIVPVTLRTKLSPGDNRRVKTITLVIDQNPAPMAAKFELGADANVSEISTRVRVNNYTDVHAVAELSDGKLYVTKTYVKASGGCSAPAAKNADEAKARLGQMRYRQFAKPGQGPVSGAREAQIMIGHPNNSGLQMDQVTQLYIPPFFVNELRLTQDDSLVLAMEGGISISEDPNIRFTYVSNGAKRFRAEAKDTDGHLFEHEWKIDDSGI
jgi:sulfur-oxidizing protein SoxY